MTLSRIVPTFVLATSLVPLAASAGAPGRKTALLLDDALSAICGEASGDTAKETVTRLAASHRVQASAGYHEAAAFIADRAKTYGLEDVRIESFPADGVTRYGTFRSYFGWKAESGVLSEVSPRTGTLADYATSKVALADYSNAADVTAPLVDVGAGTKESDYAGKDVRGKLVLAGGGVAAVHEEAVGKRGAAGIVSYQQNQTSGWSGDYKDIVRWGHLSPYGAALPQASSARETPSGRTAPNAFAFMVSLRKAAELRDRLGKGEDIRLSARVSARVEPSAFEVVSAVLRGTDPSAGEILYTSHLCHQSPGANDDASGAATVLEVARVLAALVRDGRVERPRRTIRFLWPPEISGTMCYLTRHPEVVRAARAALHLDMVGGSFATTKAILHLTRTPASLPSAVNDVVAVFGEYVVDGSRRAAMTGDVSDVLLAKGGTKEMLVSDVSPFTMGSDHEILQEGSFRIPTIYLNDWPDVFIHTDHDLPANLDATKLRRVTTIAASSGYFLATAGKDEGRRLALEVFARGASRQGDAMRRALLMGDSGAVTVARFEDALGLVDEAARVEREALSSVLALTATSSTSTGGLSDLVASLRKEVDARAAVARQVVSRHVAIPADQVAADPAARVVPKRNPALPGPVKVYYADHLTDTLGKSPAIDDTLAYELLNLVDGTRSARTIRDILNATYPPVSSQQVLDYLDVLTKAKLIAPTR